MAPLPDMVNLDFCEWLKAKVTSGEWSGFSERNTRERTKIWFMEKANEYFNANRHSAEDTEKLKTRLLDWLCDTKSDRYFDNNIKYKCLILPFGVDSDIHKELMTEWHDVLHKISGNFLDIYYAENDFERSCYKIIGEMKSIPQNGIINKLPCILLWEENIGRFDTVNINKLEVDDIFEVIGKIVASIKAKKTLERIIEEAQQVSVDCVERNRNTASNIDYRQFVSEVNNAISRIDGSVEIDKKQKASFIHIMRYSINGGSDEDQLKNVSRIRKLLRFLAGCGLRVVVENLFRMLLE